MAQVIEINVSVGELAAREERLTKTRRFEAPDRVPVVPAIAHRFLVPQVNIRFRDYYRDPEVMLRTQILAQKWLMENVRTDAYSITGAWVGVWTDFQNTFEAGSLGGRTGPPAMRPEWDTQLYGFVGKYAFGEFTIDATIADPEVTFRLIGDDCAVLHELKLKRSQLTPPLRLIAPIQRDIIEGS